MDNWVLHMDLDQFIAAVEVLRRPELAGRPVVVGGDGDPTKRGVVSTASYEARAHGVHSGVPLRVAARRCPEAVFLPVDRDAYDAASATVMATLRENGAIVQVMGWDEAFVAAPTGDPEAAARDIQRRVLAAAGLHCTVGIGHNKLQAKLATGFGKPAGVFRLTDESWYEVMGHRPTEAIWGIGTRIAKRLAALEILTVEQLAAADPERLAASFGPATGPWLGRLGQGRYDSAVSDEPHVARSRSREVTFQRDIEDWAQVRREVGELARLLMGDATVAGRPVARVIVKVRFVPFTTRTQGHTMHPATDSAEAIEAAAIVALDRFTTRRAVRLIGVRAEFAR
jgi:DNA polymerase-4